MAATAQQPQTELGKRLEVCPDPSAHEPHNQQKKLQEQSASVALYVTHPERATNVRDINPLGPDGKLSSAGAATSLKYARAQDLPSYPSVGIDTKNSGLAAASIAHANPKDIRYPTTMASDHAGKAAMLAHTNTKSKEYWKPDGVSAAGSKAALLASQGQGRDWWQPTASKDGLQAATLATRNKSLGPSIYQGSTPEGKNKALMAATLSVKGGRKRADSTPDPAPAPSYPDAANAKQNSLKAATSVSSRANEQSRLVHARNLSRELYTEHPQGLESQKREKAHQDALKGASISMAKKMYSLEKVDDQGHVQLTAGQVAARQADRSSVSSEKDLRTQALQYLTLQDAAQRLAAERLAKIENQQEQEAFKDYYGYPGKRRSRLTFRGRNRRRASSEGAPAAAFRRPGTAGTVESEEPASPDPSVPHKRGNLDIDSDDEEQAARIRNQQNAFNSKLAAADNKRMKDQQMLLAAAEKKVQAQMSKMDEKVFNETGKMSPAMMEEWDSRARAKAAAASQMRMQNHGKVDLGGGKFMDQSDIEAIALANVKPTLDEIQETAEKQRARDEEIRLEKEQVRREQQQERERESEKKMLAKRMKAEDKEAEKAKKREAKIAAEHEKTAAREEKQRAKDAAREEKQRDKETTRQQEAAVAVASRDQERKSKEVERKSTDVGRKSTDGGRLNEPETLKEKKSLWKRITPGRSEQREPGKISQSKAKGIAEVPEDGYTAAVSKPKASNEEESAAPVKEEKRDSVELTPTGATMAGDGPSTIAAPEAMPAKEQAVTPVEEKKEEEHVADQALATGVVLPSDRAAATEPTTTSAMTTKDKEKVDDAAAATPASPGKKRFSKLMGKLKRSKKDEEVKKDRDDASSFTGGAKLHKARQQDESRNASGTTSSSAPVAPGAAAAGAGAGAAALSSNPTTTNPRSRSPSISSLSSSDYEDRDVGEEESRGRSMDRLDQVASHVAAIKDSDDSASDEEGEADFEEARDQFDAGGHGLEPPREILSRKHATESPVRDSRFHEEI